MLFENWSLCDAVVFHVSVFLLYDAWLTILTAHIEEMEDVRPKWSSV